MASAKIVSKSVTTTVLLLQRNNKSIPLQISPTNSWKVISPCSNGDMFESPEDCSCVFESPPPPVTDCPPPIAANRLFPISSGVEPYVIWHLSFSISFIWENVFPAILSQYPEQSGSFPIGLVENPGSFPASCPGISPLIAK